MPDETSKKENISKCHICLQTKPLTEEHIPPKSAYNDCNGLWEYLHASESKLSPRTVKIRGGFRVPTLCADCNNSLCAPYAEQYVKYVRHLVETPVLFDQSGEARVVSVRQNTLFVAKEIATMILALEDLKFAERHDELRHFVLKRDSLVTMPFDILAFLVPKSPEAGTVLPCSGYGRLDTSALGLGFIGGEISRYPFGFVYAATIGPRYRPDQMTNVNHWFSQRPSRSCDSVRFFCRVTGVDSMHCALGAKRERPQLGRPF